MHCNYVAIKMFFASFTSTINHHRYLFASHSCINLFLKQSSIFFLCHACLSKIKDYLIVVIFMFPSIPKPSSSSFFCVRFLSFTSHCFGFVWKIIFSDLHIFIYLWEGLIFHVKEGRGLGHFWWYAKSKKLKI